MPDTPTKSRRRWVRFSLRTLLVLVVVIGVLLGWLARAMAGVRQERIAAAALKKMGCGLQYHEDYESPLVLRYTLKLLGDRAPWNVCWIEVSGRDVPFTDTELDHVKALSRVKLVWLQGTQVTDNGLVHLQRLSQLMWLDLQETRVTDAGLAHLQGLAQLKQLNLVGTPVTDKGLLHLRSLSQLRYLNLEATNVTDAGVRELEVALPTLTITH